MQALLPAFLLTVFIAYNAATASPTLWRPNGVKLTPEALRLKSLLQSKKYLGTVSRQTGGPYACNGIRNRREIRRLSVAERADWAAAMIGLRSQPSEFDGFFEWDVLVLLHVSNADEAHGGSYFLPWHRLFLLRLENAIRQTRPNFALPYWDWSFDAADAALSPVWGATYAGGARAGPAAIPNGPFANLAATYPTEHTVMRNFSSGVSGAIPPIWPSELLQRVIDTADPWGRFSDAIEAAHDLPHVYIGGDMRQTAFSPNDAIFYLHHAFVDSLWSRRQASTGIADEFGGSHDFQNGVGTVAASSNYVFEAFDLSVQDALDISCVNYVTARNPPRFTASAARTEMPENVCTNEEFLASPEMTPRRCARANRILQNTSPA